MEYKYQMNVILEQQTPYIHFQHSENGATLRATEVKPKLDKFLMSKIKNNGGNVDNSWFIKKDGSQQALNYKLRFVAQGIAEVSEAGDLTIKGYRGDKTAKHNAKKEINGMYFANMVDPKDKELDEISELIKETYKETVFHKDGIKMTVICFIPELLSKIRESIQEFFFVHNFGSRQSKGFGGFVVREIDGATDNQYKSLNKAKEAFTHDLYFYTECTSSGSSALLNHAQTVMAILKGGLNRTEWDKDNKKYLHPERYIKGYIQRKFLDEEYGESLYGSEKAYIKSKKKPNGELDLERKKKDNRDRVYDKEKYIFIRAVLGLPDHYEFSRLRNGTVNVYSLGEEGFDIVRFKSPIIVKVIGKNIFFVFNMESLSKIVDKEFVFVFLDMKDPLRTQLNKEKNYKKVKQLIEANGWKIRTPKKFDEDDVKALIKGYVSYFNENKKKLVNFKGTSFADSKNITLIVGGNNDE